MSEPVSETAESKRRGARSPSYPYVDLKTALAKAEAFRLKEGRNAASFEVAAAHFGYKPSSSGGKQTLAALRAFGLIEAEGPIKLTENALRILMDKRPDSAERDGLVRKIALLPPMHKRLWERYGADLPSDANLRHSLIFDEGFNENTVVDFIKEYKATIEYAKLKGSGSMPPRVEEQEENHPGGNAMDIPPPPAARVNPAPPSTQVNPQPLAPPPSGIGATGLSPVTFPLSGDNNLEIRLRSKISLDEFNRLKPVLIALLELSIVERPAPRIASSDPAKFVDAEEVG